ncbi:MAG: AAA family ATPase [Acidobacteria bacterium]|nr:AAA family ATPase [Acidobacteriota bacterium]
MTFGEWPSLQDFEWIQALRDCPQDPVHHAEGNVWIHTGMVLESLAADTRFRDASEGERDVLWAAAVLHDVAKPETTEVQSDGRVTAKGHSARGALRARAILWELGMPFARREQVCGMIRYHQFPFYLIERDDAQRKAAAISLSARCSQLAVLAEADIRGRVCADLEKVLENIALFESFCREEGCWDQRRHFPSAIARFEYFRRPERAIDYAAHDSTVMEVVVMSGMPGAGKDMWIRNNLPDWPVVSLDALREELGVDPGENQGTVVQAAKERAREYLRKRQRFVWNATNLSRTLRSPVIQLMADYNARVRLVYVEAPADALHRQNRSRERVVPEVIMERLLSKWDVPDPSEAHEVVYCAG